MYSTFSEFMYVNVLRICYSFTLTVFLVTNAEYETQKLVMLIESFDLSLNLVLDVHFYISALQFVFS